MRCHKTDIEIVDEKGRPLTSFGQCDNCQNFFVEKELALTCDQAKWPVVYIGAFCLECAETIPPIKL